MEHPDQSITLKVKLNRDDVGKMNTIYLKAKKKQHKINNFFISLLAVLFLLSFVTILLSNLTGEKPDSQAVSGGGWNTGLSPQIILMIVFILIYLIYNFGFPILSAYLGKKQFDSNQLAQKETGYEISREGIKLLTESSITELRFAELYKIMETKEYIFLYESNSTVRIIPKRCFEKEEDITEATQLLKEKLPVKKYEYYKL